MTASAWASEWTPRAHALLFCFIFLFLAAAGAGTWSVDAARGRAHP